MRVLVQRKVNIEIIPLISQAQNSGMRIEMEVRGCS